MSVKTIIKKCLSILLAVAMTFSLCSALVSCGGTDGKKAEFHYDDYSLPKKESYSDDYRVFPGPEEETKETIYYIDITGCAYTDLFMSITLQGLVNRNAPELYLIHDYVVQAASATFNSAQYWFDALDKSYFEEDGTTPYFEKVKINSVLEMILKYYDYIDGVVLYHERLVDRNPMAVQSSGSLIYGDMAVLNLTSMMCAQYNALPVPESILSTVNSYLVENGKEALEVVADSRTFMSQTDGAYDTSRSSLDVWYNCYRYALDQAKNGEWTFNNMSLAHNGTFNAANFDYPIAHKIFNYNRIHLNSWKTEQTEAIEEEIMALTKDHTPVIGVFHLGDIGDEEPYVRYQNNHGKYNVVTHETWNLSWSCGLPRETAVEKGEKLTYDDSKIYVAVTYSESDNNSYCHFKLPMVYDNAARGNYRMTWAIAASCVDLNPNVIKYLNATMKDGDGFATGESGIGYVRNENVLDEYKAGFFGVSDVYAKYLNGSIRTLLNRLPQSLDYVTYMDNLTAVLGGYAGISAEGTTEYNSDQNNYYFQDTPIFQNVCCLDAKSVKNFLSNVHVVGGTFYSIGLYGWASDQLTDLFNVYESLGDKFEFVTQAQLADLYCQKMSKEYNDITDADFDTYSNNEEISYLWYSDDYENYQKAFVEGQEQYRYGSKDNFTIYRYDLAEGVTSANFTYDMWGEYKIEASADLKNWTTVAKQDYYDERHQVKFELPSELTGKAVYIKITDITTEDADGYRIYHSNMQTNLSTTGSVSFDTHYDNAYLVDSDGLDGDGYRTGETIYKFPLSTSAKAINISADVEGSLEMYISADGKNFFKRTMNKYDRSSYTGYGDLYYSTLTDIAQNLYVKFNTDGALKQVRINEVNTVSTFDFSPVSCDFDNVNRTFATELSQNTSGMGSMCRVGNTDVLQYAFILGKDNSSPVLKAGVQGMFKIEISVDGKEWNTLKSVVEGENIDSEMVFDISSYAKPDNLFYVRLSKSSTSGGSVSVLYLKLEKSA